MPFWPPCCKSKANLSKHFRPGNRARVFIKENFHPGCRDLGCRNRDLGNRAGPVNRAHVKRPLGEVPNV